MNLPRLVPEAHEFLRLLCDRRCALFRRRFCRAPHLERLNQGEMVMLAKRMKTRMAFHEVTWSIGPAHYCKRWSNAHRAGVECRRFSAGRRTVRPFSS